MLGGGGGGEKEMGGESGPNPRAADVIRHPDNGGNSPGLDLGVHMYI